MFTTSSIMPAEHLDIEWQNNVTIVRFRDPRVTDASEIEELGRQLYQLLEHNDGAKLVIDLSSVEFLPSATIGKLNLAQPQGEGPQGVLADLRPAAGRAGHLSSLRPGPRLRTSARTCARRWLRSRRVREAKPREMAVGPPRACGPSI